MANAITVRQYFGAIARRERIIVIALLMITLYALIPVYYSITKNNSFYTPIGWAWLVWLWFLHILAVARVIVAGIAVSQQQGAIANKLSVWRQVVGKCLGICKRLWPWALVYAWPWLAQSIWSNGADTTTNHISLTVLFGILYLALMMLLELGLSAALGIAAGTVLRQHRMSMLVAFCVRLLPIVVWIAAVLVNQENMLASYFDFYWGSKSNPVIPMSIVGSLAGLADGGMIWASALIFPRIGGDPDTRTIVGVLITVPPIYLAFLLISIFISWHVLKRRMLFIYRDRA